MEQLTFDGERLWQGIRYHLFPSKLPNVDPFIERQFSRPAPQLTTDSLYRMRYLLRKRKRVWTIERDVWRSFTDFQRLEWLCRQAKVYADFTAYPMVELFLLKTKRVIKEHE